MDYAEESLKLHQQWKGKLSVVPKMQVKTKLDLSMAYTPGVARPCLEIQSDIEKSYELTGRWNTVAVVTDGTAVLGLGDIGPEAAMPVMEGKCVLFKAFGDVDAVPLCIRSKDVDEIVHTVSLLAGSFGGINLEDIAAPRCFEIERKLKECCDIPVFHDDQHGTAIVVAAALINALKIVEKEMKDIRIVINGAGSAGIAIARLLLAMGAENLILCDRLGAVYEGADGLNEEQTEISRVTNLEKKQGSLSDVLAGADVLIGVSAPGVVSQEMIRSMAPKAIAFPMANPTPEIMPDLALEAGAAVVGTGRSDFPNQINNVLAFPGIFRGVLDVRARTVNDAMKMAAAYALAELVSDKELKPEYILPEPFDPRIKDAVAQAVAKAAVVSGAAKTSEAF
ncbi:MULTISPECIES: NAD(P)-dependent malic enzyme [Hungatella]|uniref:NAD-dependent malic enzyme n=1 Tax=Hungatella hathewayi TaxID=154046 RepID=A0AAW9WH88_9FIRM|nr:MULTISPECIES: malic enzyme-like NAD(P)-binding protein [Hungatella]MCQ4829231.1 NAD-dependent malic enzyme [Hungatella sp. SL.1.14]MUB63327.1 NAD-dependent malic enzyme [Hungatella hathewayi]CUQ13933.1 NAD-dependent malic enzyme [Hungatella hathewayi]